MFRFPSYLGADTLRHLQPVSLGCALNRTVNIADTRGRVTMGYRAPRASKTKAWGRQRSAYPTTGNDWARIALRLHCWQKMPCSVIVQTALRLLPSGNLLDSVTDLLPCAVTLRFNILPKRIQVIKQELRFTLSDPGSKINSSSYFNACHLWRAELQNQHSMESPETRVQVQEPGAISGCGQNQLLDLSSSNFPLMK